MPSPARATQERRRLRLGGPARWAGRARLSRAGEAGPAPPHTASLALPARPGAPAAVQPWDALPLPPPPQSRSDHLPAPAPPAPPSRVARGVHASRRPHSSERGRPGSLARLFYLLASPTQTSMLANLTSFMSVSRCCAAPRNNGGHTIGMELAGGTVC